MLNNLVIKDCFGQHYKILTNRETPAGATLKAEHFHSANQALSTVHALVTPPGYWKSIVNSKSIQRSTSVGDT